jgi:hypothetical protein
MERQDDDERRKQERRQGDRRGAKSDGISHKDSGKKNEEKRQCLRLAYPLAAAPQIINMRLQVVGLSAKAVRFFIPDFITHELTLKEGDKINIALKFNDGQIVKRGGRILKEEKCQEGRKHFICLFDRHLPVERIDKEQAYLLKNFPDFCSIIFG